MRILERKVARPLADHTFVYAVEVVVVLLAPIVIVALALIR